MSRESGWEKEYLCPEEARCHVCARRRANPWPYRKKRLRFLRQAKKDRRAEAQFERLVMLAAKGTI